MAIDQHIEGAKRRLVHLAGLAERTDDAERRILSSAIDRREAVRGDIEKLRPRVDLDPEAAERYQLLTLESGQLDTVIAQSRMVLGE